jgi:gliding motility-associated protein GldC
MGKKNSEIKIQIELDEENVPEEIRWEASDKPSDAGQDARAMALGLWDHEQKNTLRIDLWTKEMEVPDMKLFYIDMIGGLSESLRSATGDQAMADMIQDFIQSLIEHVKAQEKK